MPLTQEDKAKYRPTIGIETHVQLKTRTKLFSAVGNDARHADPNTLISHIDIALPGALPVLNEKAIELATRTAFALNTEPQKHSYFERKHYFYPDSPAGYQISQLSAPIIMGGSVDVEVEGNKLSININRVQLEADAGKTIHPEGTGYSLVDLNRSGTPLLEIVSEPEITSPQEAKAFARELYLLMKYSGVSDVDLYHGNMRFDVNVSVSLDSQKGTRTEVKNLNSFRSVEGAVRYEIDRQVEVLEQGGKVIQETRGWDEAKQKTTGLRIKEEAHDYRYMPEPDIPPVELSDEFINEVKKESRTLPAQIREQLRVLHIEPSVIEDILDNEAALKHLLYAWDQESYSEAARILAFILLKHSHKLRDKPAGEISKYLLEVAEMRVSDMLSSTAGDEVIDVVIRDLQSPREVARALNLMQVSDETEIEKAVAKAIKDNPNVAHDIKSGETKAIGFLVGQVMAATKGQANPQMVQVSIRKQLGING